MKFLRAATVREQSPPLVWEARRWYSATTSQSWAAQVKGPLPALEVDWGEPVGPLFASLWGTHGWVLRALTSSEEGGLIARSSVLPWSSIEWVENKWGLSLNHAAPYLIWKHKGRLIESYFMQTPLSFCRLYLEKETTLAFRDKFYIRVCYCCCC